MGNITPLMQPTDRRGFLRRLGLAALVVVSPLARVAVRTPSTAAVTMPELPTGVFLNGWRNARRSDLSASDGLCTPLPPYYDLELIRERRPVRDSLPGFHFVREA